MTYSAILRESESKLRTTLGSGRRRCETLSTIFLILALQEVGQNGVIGIESSYIGGERLDFAITQADLDAAPKWIDILDDPPLPARQAIREARRQLGELVDNANRWRVMDITLRPMLRDDIWMYVVEFDAPFPEPPPGVAIAGSWSPPHMRIPVLMNGETVQPTRTPWPSPK